MILEIVLVISIMINILLVFYTKWVLNNYKELTIAVDDIGELIAQYVIHLKSVYELEMFYGDQTLSKLLEHGREIVEKLEDIELLGEDEEETELGE